MVRSVNDATFDAEVLGSPRPTLVEFGAAWCPPCRAIGPVLDAVAAERARLDVVSLDVEASPRIQARFRVMSLPTLILFADGRPIRQAVGYRSRAALLGLVDEALAGAS